MLSELPHEFVAWQEEDGVGQLTLNRPPLNVLDIAALRELRAVLERAGESNSLRVLVVRAEGKLFSAGVDVADHTDEKVGEMIPLFDAVCCALAEFPAPTLAVVHGHALGGGCELAISCDLVLAAESAKFGQPEIKLATFAPIAALRLPGLVGFRRAAELLLTGESIPAAEAARIGLINRALAAAELETTVEQYCDRLRALSAPALRLCKLALRRGGNGRENLPAIERLYLEELLAVADAHEGLAAFMEKREPVWAHR